MKFKVLLLLSTAIVATNLRAQSVNTAIATNLSEPHSVVTDGVNLYLSDGANNRIAKFIPSTGVLTNLAGKAGFSGTNNGSGSAARFLQPQGVVTARGGLVVADSGNQLIRYVSYSGVVSNITGIAETDGYVDGPPGAAQFRFPIGLAADTNGNIFIADSFNGAIRVLDTNNNVGTVTNGFHKPAAVAVGANGDLWVADTFYHSIYRIDVNTNVILMAGVPNSSGTEDNESALAARFSLPRGLYWTGTNAGLLISDTGNHSIRRLYYNSDPGVLGYSVETIAGLTGTPGSADGTPSVARFYLPIGIGRDVANGGYYIVDSGNNSLRRFQQTPPLPAVANPVLGYVTFPPNSLGQRLSSFNASSQAVFNNDTIIAITAENGTETYLTYGPTPENIFDDTIPTPGPTTGQTPEIYRGNGLFASETAPSIVSAIPDITIKAIGIQDGRQPSSIVQARFQFKTANPVIEGDNAAAITLKCLTTNAVMYYTIDGSDPTNEPPSLGPQVDSDKISFAILTNTILKVRAFRSNYKDSDIVSKELSPTNYAANKISFGFVNGEASSDFVAAAGQRFYAPVTLSLLPGQKIYSMQFNLTVSNLNTAPAITPAAFFFQSMLMKPLPNTQPPVFVPIPPAMFDGSTFTNLMFTNTAANLLGVGWFERYTSKLLYDTLSQDLITYSLAHDNLFTGNGGKVIVGGYSFLVPAGATNGDQYQIQLGRPSGTEDGISKPVFIDTPTNGSLASGALNATKNVTVGIRQYIVGDVAPFRWFNAGDFGNTNLLNNDVLQAFQSAVYFLNSPPAGSDFFDAMDSSNGTTNGLLNASSGDDTVIDGIAQGDGVIAVDDIFVTYRRSLDPYRTWYARYWSNGVRQSITVSNITSFRSSRPAQQQPTLASRPGGKTTANLNVVPDDVQGTAGATVNIPVRAQVTGGLPVRVLMLNVTVTPLDSPAISVPVQFVAGGDLGLPMMSQSQTTNNFSGAWLSNQVVGISGSNVLGTLTVTLPASCASNSAYRVHFDHLSASPNGFSLFTTTVQDSFIMLSNPNASSLNDGIPDAWRLRNLGSIVAPWAAANADPDGDGCSNYAEFIAGTNPLDVDSRLKLQLIGAPDLNGVTLRWPSIFSKHYFLEGASNLIDGWGVISTNVGDGSLQQYIHTNGSLDSYFYRLRVQP